MAKLLTVFSQIKALGFIEMEGLDILGVYSKQAFF
jgi:hypothetical protein